MQHEARAPSPSKVENPHASHVCISVAYCGTKRRLAWNTVSLELHNVFLPYLFQAYAEQIRQWLDGEDEVDPPLQFPPPELGPVLGPPVLEFSSWSEISEMCGDSRYWGGMHFEVND